MGVRMLVKLLSSAAFALVVAGTASSGEHPRTDIVAPKFTVEYCRAPDGVRRLGRHGAQERSDFQQVEAHQASDDPQPRPGEPFGVGRLRRNCP